MKLRVIDFESTGTPEDRDRGERVGIVEIGYTDVTDQLEIGPTFTALVNPNIPIPPVARAIHHISDADVADAMNYMQACQILMKGMEPGDVFVAHNSAFERNFFGGGTHDWICTMRCARHVWEDAPGFSNQVLRYWLDVDSEFAQPELAMPPHRAGPDTYVTAHILTRLLLERSPDDLIQLTKTLPLVKIVPFSGEHKGKLFSELDEGMLEWITNKDFSPEIMNTARHWLRAKREQRNKVF
jgi:exodeoxyribonuclease X